jgi:predicted metal-dependent hydrolase
MPNSPLHYRVRVSARSRNIRLRVTVRHGLEVIVPRDYDTGGIPAIIERKKHWIRAALERAYVHRKFFEPEPTWSLPQQISLPAISQVWHVTARESPAASVTVREVGPNELLVFGAIHNEQKSRESLARWLMRKTRQHLVPRLKQLSELTGLRHRRTFVKRPRTRWASCSRHKSVSLNAKLLFLPPAYVDYVMIHELCHLAEMNHSKRFWGLVAGYSPGYKSLDMQLREMWKTVPRWAN